ncbi:MAG: hypothetical protein ACI9MB_000117, partial [Verrucomicrobiales bacterium]
GKDCLAAGFWLGWWAPLGAWVGLSVSGFFSGVAVFNSFAKSKNSCFRASGMCFRLALAMLVSSNLFLGIQRLAACALLS